jgi:hypothetical protein
VFGVWCLVSCWWLVLMFVMALDNSNAPRDSLDPLSLLLSSSPT